MKISYIPAALFAALLATSLRANASTVHQNLSATMFSINNLTRSVENYSREDIGLIVRMMISDMKGVPVYDIAEEDRLTYDLGIDSLGIFTLCYDCMEWFDITINPADVLMQANRFTVKLFCDMINHFHNEGGTVFSA